MGINIIISLLLSLVFGVIIGYLFGNYNNVKTIIKYNNRCGFTDEEVERMHVWNIVRYRHNGEYDCVWSSGHTKREADKRCKELNEDYHMYYGKYVVERCGIV